MSCLHIIYNVIKNKCLKINVVIIINNIIIVLIGINCYIFSYKLKSKVFNLLKNKYTYINYKIIYDTSI